MGTKKQVQRRDNNILSASEIGQYHYCPMSWYLQRCGYEPKSEYLEIGKEKHVELGRVMYHAEKNIKKSRFLAIIGYLLLVVVILFLLFEVIL